MSPSVQFGFSLGMRLYGRRFGYLQRVVFTKNFWNFKAIPNKNHFDVCLKQTCSKKFKRFLWIGLHKCCSCMNNDLFHMGKQSLPIHCLPLIRKGLIEHVTYDLALGYKKKDIYWLKRCLKDIKTKDH